MGALACALGYTLYAWLLSENSVEPDDVQVYSVPLALVAFTIAWLLPKSTDMQLGLDLSTANILLLPALVQSLAERSITYSLLLGMWGLGLLVMGISMGRRVLLIAGIVGQVAAALRQLWVIVTVMPPGVTVCFVGVGLLLAAVGLASWRSNQKTLLV
jgi:hypothetical protein